MAKAEGRPDDDTAAYAGGGGRHAGWARGLRRLCPSRCHPFKLTREHAGAAPRGTGAKVCACEARYATTRTTPGRARTAAARVAASRPVTCRIAACRSAGRDCGAAHARYAGPRDFDQRQLAPGAGCLGAVPQALPRRGAARRRARSGVGALHRGPGWPGAGCRCRAQQRVGRARRRRPGHFPRLARAALLARHDAAQRDDDGLNPLSAGGVADGYSPSPPRRLSPVREPPTAC